MSKLSELIAQLCPDGVENKTLGEIATISRGGNFQKKDFVDYGVPLYTMGRYIHNTIYLQVRLLALFRLM